MRCAVIIYHKNALKLYKRKWIDKCINSIKSQTFQGFTIFEHNYGGGNDRFADIKDEYVFLNTEFSNHIYSLNYLHSLAFNEGFDVVYNCNLDDFYAPDRFEKQLERIESGFQVVSSNFYYITEIGNKDIITRSMNMFKSGDIRYNLLKNHNVIAHPCVAMHRSVWGAGFRYNENEIGFEDMSLWKKVIQKFKFSIMQDYLLFYRIHNNQITKHHKV